MPTAVKAVLKNVSAYPLVLYSFVEQRSARQSVTLEIAGSIPVEAATELGASLSKKRPIWHLSSVG